MRFDLGGYGLGIPEFALPVSELDETGGLWLVMSDGSTFSKQDWIDQGFTHCEVFCVGGQGGIGSSTAQVGGYVGSDFVYRTMPDDVWNAHLLYIRVLDWITANEWDHLYAWGDSSVPETVVDHEIRINPTHRAAFQKKYGKAYLYFERLEDRVGGAGGGGGLQKFTSALEDLPDDVSVTVGSAGADAPYGQTHVDGDYTPPPPDPYLPFVANASAAPPYYTAGQVNAARETIYNWVYSFKDTDWPPALRNTVPGVQRGGDGGTSMFGEFCKASGGKGGFPGRRWQSGSLVDGGQGGEGGIGDSDISGGGAAGSTTLEVDGESGVWDGTTGSGGGGGHAGSVATTAPSGGFGTPVNRFVPASDGGRGSFAFSEPSIAGERGRASGFRPLTITFDPTTGEIVSEVLQPPDPVRIIVPGAGGGAKLSTSFAFGSTGGAGSPNGAVLIRLSTID